MQLSSLLPHNLTASACRSDGQHRLGYEFSWIKLFRARSDPTPSPAELKPHLGDHIKSAIQYTFLWDQRQLAETGGAVRGTAVRLNAEIAGLTPDQSLIQFVKARADMQRAVPLSASTVATFDASAGARKSLPRRLRSPAGLQRCSCNSRWPCMKLASNWFRVSHQYVCAQGQSCQFWAATKKARRPW
jgi:hypothetical protein